MPERLVRLDWSAGNCMNFEKRLYSFIPFLSFLLIVSFSLYAQAPNFDAPWRDRAAAFKKILTQENALQNPQTQSLLIQYLEKEDRVLAKIDDPADAFDNEDYAENLALLVDAVAKIAEITGDQRANEALLRSSYNPDSELGNFLASRYENLPALISLAQDSNAVNRANAVYLLGSMLLKSRSSGKSSISPEAASKAKATIVKAAVNDQEVPVRQLAVRSIGRIGDNADLLLLQKVALQDPASLKTQSGALKYPVREEAMKATQMVTSRASESTKN